MMWLRRWGKFLFLGVALMLAAVFILYSYALTRDLAQQERERMDLWAEATHEIIDPDMNALTFPLHVIEGNRSIPVILTDSAGNLLIYRNLDDSSEADFELKVSDLVQNGNKIEISFSEDERQYIYYEDSTILKRLMLYPWVELTIIIAFMIISYIGINASKKVEQNKLWVGLSKETAHQLGTPISSLMGWIEYLKSQDVENAVIVEMMRDVNRLSDVSARFSKVGSLPELTEGSVIEAVENAVKYMQKRITSKIRLNFLSQEGNYVSLISEPLLQWVIENLIKNAVDATDGSGQITVSISESKGLIIILVKDTGKGIPKKKWKQVFVPGYTTKKRGWGLGLTLTKRIIEEFHGGKIEIVESSSQTGTVFRIILPQKYSSNNKDKENVKK